MKSLAVIESGLLLDDFSDHQGYVDRLYKLRPQKAKDFHITCRWYMKKLGCFVNFHNGKKTVGVEGMTRFNVTDDWFEWLEAICNGYWECILLSDAEAQYSTMVRYKRYKTDKNGIEYARLSILGSVECYLDEQENWIHNEKTFEKANKTEENQIIFDMVITTEKIVSEMYQALTNALAQLSDIEAKENSAHLPIVRDSEIARKFLQKH